LHSGNLPNIAAGDEDHINSTAAQPRPIGRSDDLELLRLVMGGTVELGRAEKPGVVGDASKRRALLLVCLLA
jgi:hypothetical protein